MKEEKHQNEDQLFLVKGMRRLRVGNGTFPKNEKYGYITCMEINNDQESSLIDYEKDEHATFYINNDNIDDIIHQLQLIKNHLKNK